MLDSNPVCLPQFLKYRYGEIANLAESGLSSVTLGQLDSLIKQFNYGEKRKEQLSKIVKQLFVIDINFKEVIERYGDIVADVIDVKVTGNPNSYTFGVTIISPDTGCNQYANWQEVISLDGQLIYRRVLGHSHVSEQPFTRTGGLVNISENTEVMVRAQMHPTSYGGKVFKDSVANGFECTILSGEFAKALSEQAPLPTSCLYQFYRQERL